jgi:hypothetical protein
MAKGQKKSNKEVRKPKADKKSSKTISVGGGADDMRNLMAGSNKK